MHRVSGIAIFLGVAVLLYFLDQSLVSETRFYEIKSLLTENFIVKLIVWLILSGFIYHASAGVKHLIMDLGFGETLEGGKQAAAITVVIAAILIVFAGVWIW